jgi:hypothetical protein
LKNEGKKKKTETPLPALSQGTKRRKEKMQKEIKKQKTPHCPRLSRKKKCKTK